jgi:uncharacterized membrane protein
VTYITFDATISSMSVKQSTRTIGKSVTKPRPLHKRNDIVQAVPVSGSLNNLDNLKQLHIARELADVTWRLAVPVIGLCALGIIADRSWGTKPWLTLLGSVAGFVIAGKLVSLQIKRVTAEEEKS